MLSKRKLNKIKQIEDYKIKWGLGGYKFYIKTENYNYTSNVLTVIESKDESKLPYWFNTSHSEIRSLPSFLRRLKMIDTIKLFQQDGSWDAMKVDEFRELCLIRRLSGIQ